MFKSRFLMPIVITCCCGIACTGGDDSPPAAENPTSAAGPLTGQKQAHPNGHHQVHHDHGTPSVETDLRAGHSLHHGNDTSPADTTHAKRHRTTAHRAHSEHSKSSRPHARAGGSDSTDSLDVFRRRILPILQAKKPSSCTECHLSGVDLTDYILSDQAATFAALRERGLIDVQSPDKSKILTFIRRKPSKPNLINEQVRRQEYEAFRAWIRVAVADPTLLKSSAGTAIVGSRLPVEVIRHARRDRVLASFIDNVWLEVSRCSACHSPDRNQKQVRKFGKRVSWITLRDPQATMQHLIEASLIDAEFPADSLLLTKPTLQVEHGGGRKMVVGDRTYRQFRRFIDDYAAVVAGKYKSARQLPAPSAEVSVASEIWLKLIDVPVKFDQQLLAVRLFPRDGAGWSQTASAAGDRTVFGKGRLWQQRLSVIAPRESALAKEIRRTPKLPPGRYLLRIFVDRTGRLRTEYPTELGGDEFVGETVVESRWPAGFGRMTVVPFPDG